MKNNKGFTVIELAVSFCLVAAISIILLQLVLSLKEVYLSGDVKTTLLNKQGIMTKKIYDDLNKKDLTSVNSCGLSCLSFNYNDGTISKLLVDPGNKTITYADYTMKLDSSSYFGNLEFDDNYGNTSSEKAKHIFKINIPIKSKLIDNEDFGIKIVKIYDNTTTSIKKTIDIQDAKVTLSGVETNLTYVKPEDDIYIKLFYQKSGTTFDNDFNHFIKNKNSDTLSTLTSLEALRTTKDLENIINKYNEEIDSQTNDATERKKLKDKFKQLYQNGYFSFLLDYNASEMNNIIAEDTGYSRWRQTSNFANKEIIAGVNFTDLGIMNNSSCGFIGLKYNKEGNSWVNGCEGDYYQLGSKNGIINGIDNVADSVALYAEAKEYYCKYKLSEITINGVSLSSKCN